MRLFTKSLTPRHFDTISKTIRHDSNAMIKRSEIVSRPRTCKVVHKDSDDSLRDRTTSDSNTDSATF